METLLRKKIKKAHSLNSPSNTRPWLTFSPVVQMPVGGVGGVDRYDEVVVTLHGVNITFFNTQVLQVGLCGARQCLVGTHIQHSATKEKL